MMMMMMIWKVDFIDNEQQKITQNLHERWQRKHDDDDVDDDDDDDGDDDDDDDITNTNGPFSHIQYCNSYCQTCTNADKEHAFLQ